MRKHKYILTSVLGALSLNAAAESYLGLSMSQEQAMIDLDVSSQSDRDAGSITAHGSAKNNTFKLNFGHYILDNLAVEFEVSEPGRSTAYAFEVVENTGFPATTHLTSKDRVLPAHNEPGKNTVQATWGGEPMYLHNSGGVINDEDGNATPANVSKSKVPTDPETIYQSVTVDAIAPRGQIAVYRGETTINYQAAVFLKPEVSLTDRGRVYGKLGYSVMDTTIAVTSLPGSPGMDEKLESFVFGGGVSYQLNSTDSATPVHLFAEFQQYDATQFKTFDTGIRFHF